ncbi:MAG TPA: hypothetical protein VFF00_03465 [Candidatus Elarobacter sp.]|nr:hypothetical protein [Candidatus Elarobacter sp.]
MRLLTGVLSLAVAAVALAAPATRADAAFSDALCPEASQYVIAMGALAQSDPPQKIYDAAHATTNAYSTCAKRQLTDANVEPGVHYAQTRNAQFGIVEARALLALNRPAEAKAVLENSKRLAQEVFDWRRSGNGASDLGSRDNRPSFYHDSAKDILDAANAMLAKLNAPPAPAASASPAAAPHR